MPSIRQLKVAAQIQRIVATVLLREVADPRVDGLISVTRVEISPDLREAKVYLSVLGSKRTPATVLQGIKSAGRHIQGQVGKSLAMRFMPRLTYLLDESLKKQAEILQTIALAMGGNTAAPAATPPADPVQPAPPAEVREAKRAHEGIRRMNKPTVKIDVLKKMIARLVKAAPARHSEPADPLARLIHAFLEYDCDDARASHAQRKIAETMVDFNELRVTPAIELAALLGVRYPFAESRCSALHRTLQSIFDREHQMRLDRLKEMKKTEIRPYFQSLAGITPYVEAAVCVDAFGVPAAPIDTKLLLWLISKDVLPEGMDIKAAQHLIERHLKAAEAEDFFLGSRKEIDDWSPKSWPQVAKAYSPILAPPPLDAAGQPQDPSKRDGKKPEPPREAVKEVPKETPKETHKPKPLSIKKK